MIKIIKWFKRQYESFKLGNNPMFGIGLLLVPGVVSILVLPWIFTLPSILPSFTATGAVGDTINGVAGPFIALGAAMLTFLAFYAQLNANNAQKKQFEDQATDVKRERFENRFFEFIRLHRANVEEQNVQNKITGRKVFTTYYFELRYIYTALRRSYEENKPSSELSTKQLTNLAYLIFFYGIGHVTESVFEQIAPAYSKMIFFKNLITKLEREKNAYSDNKSDANNDLIVESQECGKAVFIQVYRPFTGHGTKVGHYYRHMLQAIAYVDEQKSSFLTDDNKREYVKMLRAQLSNFEQIMLHYNSVSLLGQGWDSYIKKYSLLVNVPLAFADFGYTPEVMYKDIIKVRPHFFHWVHLKDKLAIESSIL